MKITRSQPSIGISPQSDSSKLGVSLRSSNIDSGSDFSSKLKTAMTKSDLPVPAGVLGRGPKSIRPTSQ